jgi:lauroyl/myristoyl acyltransferase
MACTREGFAPRFRISARDLSAAAGGPGSEEDRARTLVRAYLGAVEDAVRARPEQYLWMHRRWKCRPPGEPDLYA